MGALPRAWRLALGAFAVAALTAAGLLLWRRDASAAPPPLVVVTAAPARPAPTRAPAPRKPVVYVSGAVATPGVYTLRAGARVDDAVAAAGGPAVDADMEHINLAAPLADGQQVNVPRQGEVTPTPVRAARAGAATPTPPGNWLLDINTATSAQLRGIPGIGKTTADRIVSYREQNGPYSSVDDLLKAGVRQAELDRIKSRLTVQ